MTDDRYLATNAKLSRILFYLAWRCPHDLTSMQTCDPCGRTVTTYRKGA